MEKNMLKTIGFGGQLFSGKDSAADYLAAKLTEQCNVKWIRNAFANKVKEVFEQAFGKDREWIEKYKRVDEPTEGFLLNVRQCLIGIGDGFRKMKPSIWIERAFENQTYHQIISDIRYCNESQYIRQQQGGLTILLWRKGHTNNLPNASEQELMPFVNKCLEFNIEGLINENLGLGVPFDFFLKNEGDLQSLYNKIDHLIIPELQNKWSGIFKANVFDENTDAAYFRKQIFDGFRMP